MPSTVLPGGIRIDVPEGVQVFDRAADGRRRATRRGPGGAPAAVDSVEESLTNSGFEVTRAIDLDARNAPAPRAGRRAGPAQARVTVNVSLDATQQAALLLEEDGFYSWQLPVAVPQAAPLRRRRGAVSGPFAPRTATFEVPLGGAPVRRGPRRSLMGKVVGKATVWVLKFAGPPALGLAVRYFEKDRRTGLVRFTKSDPSGWVVVDDPKKIPMPNSQLPRVLLLVHGTFSSTKSGFGALSVNDFGRQFLDEAIKDYDLVLGFDHRTLSVDPAENATRLLEDLQKAFGDRKPVIHVIAHSRGALVVRSLAEKLLPASGWGATIEKIILAGPTNKGTELAEPENWTELIDLYTNLVNVGANALKLAGPHTALAGEILADVLDAVGALVKTLASQIVNENKVPGLAAMEPDGPFVHQINLAQPGQPTSDELAFYVITSDFDVSLMDSIEAPGKFPPRLAKFLADGVVDQLMDVQNDLVVDVPSMSSIDLPESFIQGCYPYGTNGLVYHTNYFAQPEVIEQMKVWLSMPGGGGGTANGGRGRSMAGNSHDTVSGGGGTGPEPNWTAPTSPPRRGARRGGAVRGARSPLSTPDQPISPRRDTHPDMSSNVPATSPSGGLSKMPEAAPIARVNAGAHMPGEIKLGEIAPLTVQISREEISDLGPGATAHGGLSVDAGRELTITATGLLNLDVEGESRVVVPVPDAGSPMDMVFDVRAKAAGPGAIQVIVRQGPTRMVRLKVEPTIVSGTPKLAARAAAQAAEITGNPDSQDRCRLEITERQTGTETCYEFRFSLRVPNAGDVNVCGMSKPIKGNKQQYVADLFKRIEDAWNVNQSDIDAFETQLKSYGGQLWDDLVPAEVGEKLWKYRNMIDGIQVYSSEPFIPWEIVHLKDPKTETLPSTMTFLGQLGLCRWLWGYEPGYPPEKLQMRKDKFMALVPEYPKGEWELDTKGEWNHLRDTYGAERVSTDPNDLTKLLKSPDKFDVFHFAGHGAGDQESISEERIILQMVPDPDRYGVWVETAYHSTVVSQNAVLGKPAGRRPLIFLNACQIGRIGYHLTSIGGFAQAFIKAGAGAFVGTLWGVDDKLAINFTKTFYAELAAGSTLAEASKKARNAAKKAGEPTWLAYTVYGEPFAKVSS